MRYKVGDKVRVRAWDDMVKEFGICGSDFNGKEICCQSKSGNEFI